MNEKQKDYLKRINDVISYIHSNLSEELNIDKLASVSNFSTYHFHRILKAHLGEPLWQYVKRIRLETGAKLLKYSNDPISSIAYQIGYDTPSSFSSAFKKFYGISPKEYKNSKGVINMLLNPPEMEINLPLTPEIINFKPQKYIYRRLIGEFKKETFATAWISFYGFLRENNLFPQREYAFGLPHDDPSVTEPDKLTYDICFAINGEINKSILGGDTNMSVLEGGKYAKFTFTGPHDWLELAYNKILAKWLPKSENELGIRPLFEKFVNSPKDTAQENLITEIFIPIK